MVLPVANAGKALAENIQHLCDVLSDLTDWFEVLLVDEGASEHASETASSLAAEYPQVHVVRTRSLPIPTSALQSAVKQAQGEIVFIQRGHESCRPSDLRRLWETHGHQHAVAEPDVSRHPPRRVQLTN